MKAQEWDAPKSHIDRGKTSIMVTHGKAYVWMDRKATREGPEQNFLLTIPGVMLTCYGGSDNPVFSLHLKRKLVGDIITVLEDAENEAEGELCWTQEQEYEAYRMAQEAAESRMGEE